MKKLYNKDLVYWYASQYSNLYYKILLKKKLTKKQKNLYYILDEYDFYAPKKYHFHNNL